MLITRRAFAAGAAGLIVAPRALAAPASTPAMAAALRAIAAYAQAHRRQFELPGLTLGLTTADGFETVQHFGFANRDSRSPITDNTLFQIGSITKVMTALVLHQLAAEGRLDLNADVGRLMPDLPIPKGMGITTQHLIDHVAGLPGDAPVFAPGGLWAAYKPGEHWHYSNTAYDMLGIIAENIGGKPLARLFHDRIFSPLGMRRSRGAIVAADRTLYAQGYETADLTVPYLTGEPLVPAAWVDVTFGAGSAASTAADMNRFMRALADAATGRASLGLPATSARAFTSHFVRTGEKRGTSELLYGNGLMRVTDKGRDYLHHTGGMVSFSSAFHVDPASGTGAFASSTVSGFHGYRPRSLTLFAIQALDAARGGKPLPAPPSLEAPPLANARDYVGRYAAGSRSFEVRGGPALALVAGGRSAALIPSGENLFRTSHPDMRGFELLFERSGGKVVGASWGPESFAREGATFRPPSSNPSLARLTGRYVNDSPWWAGAAMIVERGGKLWLGTSTPLVPIGDNLWRAGEQSWSPERVAFANFVNGRPQTLLFSGEKFLRHDI